MSDTTTLALQGLSCGHCVKRVKEVLEKRDDVSEAEVSLDQAVVTGEATPQALIEAIKQAGYHATLAQGDSLPKPKPLTVTAPAPDGLAAASDPATITLSLSGLSCDHCIGRVTEVLEQRPDVSDVQVTLERAVIDSSASAQSLIETIERAGYQATEGTTDAGSWPPATTPSPDTESVAPMVAETSPPENESVADDLQLLIDGMSCASCVSRVETALAKVPEVSRARVNLADRSALVSGHPDPQALLAAVSHAGYSARLMRDDQQRRAEQQKSGRQQFIRFSWQAGLALLTGIPVMIWGMVGHNMMLTADNLRAWQGISVITLLVMIIAGGHFYRSAWKSLRNRTATMDTLVALGTAVAWLYSAAVVLRPDSFPAAARHLYFEASTMIIGLINLGHALEQRARQHASQSLQKLLDLTPDTARVMTAEGDKIVPVSEISAGMMIRLRAGDRVPVDGEVTEGQGQVDEAMLTGEAWPQKKQHGDNVHAGTLVSDGNLTFRTTATGCNTSLARIISLVRNAQSSKPQIGQLADKISAVFVPTVILIALLSGLIWYLVGPQPQFAYSMVVITTVLIIACPCALGLATPMSVIAGVGRAAEAGVLVKDADALQQASNIDTVIFDKTGTLTLGKPTVTAIKLFNGFDEQQVLDNAAAAESHSSHPLAAAIIARAGNKPLAATYGLTTLPGKGLRAEVAGRQILLGNAALLSDEKIDLSSAQTAMEGAAEQGETPVLLAIDQQLAALFTISDPLRPEAAAVVKQLSEQGLEVLLLSGDRQKTAEVIAARAGIHRVIAEVLPDQKAATVRELQQQGRRVAMVGDGINDAPALAQADAGIAMSGGSDIAIETASLALMRQDLQAIADGLLIARATLRNMKQNLAGAFVYNCLGIPVAAGVLYPLTSTLLNPVIAGAAMALSSITVVSNANRLLRYRLPQQTPRSPDATR